MNRDEDDIGQFTDNDLTDDGAKAVAEALKVNTRVRHLNLMGEKWKGELRKKKKSSNLKNETGNKIENEGVKALSEMLKDNTTLINLYLNSEGKKQRL